MKTKLCGILMLFLIFIVQFTNAQNTIITGVVSDAFGTLPGASVIIEGTAKGTVTDLNGIYTIEDIIHVSQSNDLSIVFRERPSGIMMTQQSIVFQKG